MSDNEQVEESIHVEYDGYPQDHVEIVQRVYGLVPSLHVDVIIEDDLEDVTFKVSTYGTGSQKEFMETIVAMLQTIIEKLPDSEENAEDSERE